MARPRIDREYHIFDKQKKGIWHIDLRKVGGKVFSSGLASTKQNRKQLETEVIPLLLKKLKGEMTDDELKDRLVSAKTATTVAVFVARHASNRQPHIRHAYELVFKKHILPTFGNKRLEDITGLDILDWQNSLNKKAGFATVKKARIMLMQMFDDALLARVISTSPMLGTKLPKRLTEEREINPFGQQEIKALLENASGYFRNVVGILIYSGMRPSELCALDWADVDFENKEIFIRQTLKRDRSVGLTKTKAAKRHIQMLPPVESFLKNQFLRTGQNGSRVFQSKIYKIGFTSIDYWQKAFSSLLQKCDLVYRNLYQCRHTFASMMLGNGEDLIWVSSMLGHKSPDITLKCYAKLKKQSINSVRRGSKIAIVFVTRATLASEKLYKIKGFVMQIRVYYEDTDIGGVVYYANYLKFIERARSELFFTKGLSPILDGGAFVVRNVNADYLKPAVFGDELVVKTEFAEMKAASLTLSQEIFRGEEKLFAATVRLAFVRDGKPAKIPQNATTVFRTDS